MSTKKQAQKATTRNARANQTRQSNPNRPNRQTSTDTPARKRKPLTQEQRDRKNAKERERRAALKASSKALPGQPCVACSSCRWLAQCRASGRTDGFPQEQVLCPPALPPEELLNAPVFAQVTRRLGPPQAIVVPLSGVKCSLGVAQPVYAESSVPRTPNSQLVAALKQIIDIVSPGYAATHMSTALPVRPFRRDVCNIVELRNDELPEEGWE